MRCDTAGKIATGEIVSGFSINCAFAKAKNWGRVGVLIEAWLAAGAFGQGSCICRNGRANALPSSEQGWEGFPGWEEVSLFLFLFSLIPNQDESEALGFFTD